MVFIINLIIEILISKSDILKISNGLEVNKFVFCVSFFLYDVSSNSISLDMGLYI